MLGERGGGKMAAALGAEKEKLGTKVNLLFRYKSGGNKAVRKVLGRGGG